jgi:hypothetical protein
MQLSERIVVDDRNDLIERFSLLLCDAYNAVEAKNGKR